MPRTIPIPLGNLPYLNYCSFFHDHASSYGSTETYYVLHLLSSSNETLPDQGWGLFAFSRIPNRAMHAGRACCQNYFPLVSQSRPVTVGLCQVNGVVIMEAELVDPLFVH